MHSQIYFKAKVSNSSRCWCYGLNPKHHQRNSATVFLFTSPYAPNAGFFLGVVPWSFSFSLPTASFSVFLFSFAHSLFSFHASIHSSLCSGFIPSKSARTILAFCAFSSLCELGLIFCYQLLIEQSFFLQLQHYSQTRQMIRMRSWMIKGVLESRGLMTGVIANRSFQRFLPEFPSKHGR